MDYILTSNGELYHAAPNRGWEKDDHKYIKREWKNGRWQYTYPSDVKSKSTNRVNNAAPSKVSKEYQAETEYNSKKNSYPTSKSAKTKPMVDLSRGAKAVAKITSAAVTKTASKVGDTKGKNSSSKVSKEYQAETEYNSKKNSYLSKNPTKIAVDCAQNMVKGSEKVADALRTYTTKMKAFDKTANALSAKIRSAGNTVKVAADMTRVITDAHKSEKTAFGALKTALVNTVAERVLREHEDYTTSRFFERYGSTSEISTWIRSIEEGKADNSEINRDSSVDGFAKDIREWWGASETARLDEAKSNLRTAEARRKDADEKEIIEREIYDKVLNETKTGRNVNIMALNEAYDEWARAADLERVENARYLAAREEFENAVEAYMKTPAGELERKYDNFVNSMSDSIDSGKDWVEDRLDGLEDWWDNLRR